MLVGFGPKSGVVNIRRRNGKMIGELSTKSTKGELKTVRGK